VGRRSPRALPGTGIRRSAVTGRQLPDAISGGNPGFRAHSRPVVRITSPEFRVRPLGMFPRRLPATVKHTGHGPRCTRLPRPSSPGSAPPLQRALAPGHGSCLLALRSAFSVQAAGPVCRPGCISDALRSAFAFRPPNAPPNRAFSRRQRFPWRPCDGTTTVSPAFASQCSR